MKNQKLFFVIVFILLQSIFKTLAFGKKGWKHHFKTWVWKTLFISILTIFSKVKCLKINGVKLIKRKEDGRTGREFIKCIADTVREKCSQIIKQSNFLSLLSDGSQARKTSKEKELILLRTQRNGHPEYLVISLLEMSRFGGATANAIIDGINSIFQDKKSKFYMSSDEFTYEGYTADN